MRPEFTPGPWRVITPLIHVANETQTYTVDGPDSDFMYLANIEDAHLIAAAPDLYAALEHLEDWMSNLSSACFCGGEGHEENCYLGTAQAALAKARGEAAE